MSAAIPFSEVTIIASALGVFFLIVAFYKSIFHKRKAPLHTSLKTPEAPAPAPQHPVKLSDPFQQVSVDAIQETRHAKTQNENADFYPKLPSSPNNHVSAFRQYNPNLIFSPTEQKSANDETYEWE